MKFLKLWQIILLAVIMLLVTMPMCLAAEAVSYNDLVVLGIPYNAQKSDIISSSGKPTQEGALTRSMYGKYYITYGGVTFNLNFNADASGIASIVINNRDATTVRGLAVGDSKSKIINTYGNSYKIVRNGYKEEYRYLWGIENSDYDIHGISFQCDGEIISQITIFP